MQSLQTIKRWLRGVKNIGPASPVKRGEQITKANWFVNAF